MRIVEEDNQETKQDMNGSANNRKREKKKKKTMQNEDTAHREARIFESLTLDSGFATACTEYGMTTSSWCDGGTAGGEHMQSTRMAHYR